MSADYDGHEPVPGLPQRLPAGERMLWQGRPDWRAMALNGLHLRGLALYFTALIAWNLGSAVWSAAPEGPASLSALRLTGLAAAALALVAAFAWGVARTTLYTITDRRVVMRFGIALPITMNLPFTMIEAAALHGFRDGSGDVALALGRGNQLGFFVMWPHARPWHLKRAQPMLRCVPDAARAAQILGRALAASADMAAPALAEAADRTTQTAGRPHAAAA